MMDAVCESEMSVYSSETARCYIPEDSYLQVCIVWWLFGRVMQGRALDVMKQIDGVEEQAAVQQEMNM
jgi:hypothetical protein